MYEYWACCVRVQGMASGYWSWFLPWFCYNYSIIIWRFHWEVPHFISLKWGPRACKRWEKLLKWLPSYDQKHDFSTSTGIPTLESDDSNLDLDLRCFELLLSVDLNLVRITHVIMQCKRRLTMRLGFRIKKKHVTLWVLKLYCCVSFRFKMGFCWQHNGYEQLYSIDSWPSEQKRSDLEHNCK